MVVFFQHSTKTQVPSKWNISWPDDRLSSGFSCRHNAELK